MPQNASLEAADRAAEFEGVYRSLCTEEGKLTVKQDELKKANEALPEKEKKLESAKNAFDEAQKELEARRKEEEDARPGIIKAREMDRDLSNLEGNRKKAEQEFDSRSEMLRRFREKTAEKEDSLRVKKDGLRREDVYLQEHAEDEKLVSAFEGISVSLRNLAAGRESEKKADLQVVQGEKELDALKKTAERIAAQAAGRQESFDRTGRKLKELEEEKENLLAGKTLQEIERTRDALVSEVAAIKAVANFDEQRLRLKDGEACPLCGSVHHPYAQGNIPSADGKEAELARADSLLKSARLLLARIDEANDAVAGESRQLAEIRNEAQRAESNAAHQAQMCEERRKHLEELRKQIEAQKAELAGQTACCGIMAEELSDAETLLGDLAKRKTAWQDHSAKREKIKQQAGDLEKDLAVLKQEESRAEEEQEKAKKALEALVADLAEKQKERAGFFGEKDPEEEELRLRRGVVSADAKTRELGEAKNDAEKQHVRCLADISRLTAEIDRDKTVLQSQNDSFNGAIKQKGFQNREDFRNALLSPEERDRLRAQKMQLAEDRASLNTEKNLNGKALQEKRAEKKTEKSADELSAEWDGVERERKENEADLAGKTARRSLDDQNREKNASLQREKNEAEKDFQKWDRLWTILGRNSNSFSDFVQTLTFDRVVRYANQWLKKMVPRYQLKRRAEPEKKKGDRGNSEKGNQPAAEDAKSKENETNSGEARIKLDLDVIDFEQGGESRVVENLSGGERFMVSLALALGISRLAGKNVRIDTIFLDEGFGTLDETALENAIDMLELLQREGKMIGIVTHVERLQGEDSRIPTQIQVEKIGNGRSALHGPGVACVKEEPETSAKPKKHRK